VKTKKTIKEVKYKFHFVDYFNKAGKCVGGGLDKNPLIIENEVWAEIKKDQILTDENKIVDTGVNQIHISGTRRGIRELGKLFIALSYYHPPRDDYVYHLDIADLSDNPIIHLIAHLPVSSKDKKKPFTQIFNLIKAIISTDGVNHQDITNDQIRK
jgi:hypothetical protein